MALATPSSGGNVTVGGEQNAYGPYSSPYTQTGGELVATTPYSSPSNAYNPWASPEGQQWIQQNSTWGSDNSGYMDLLARNTWALTNQASPLLEQYQQQLDPNSMDPRSYNQQLAQLQAAYARSAGAAGANAGVENAAIDLKLQQLGIDRAALQRQPGLLDQLLSYNQGRLNTSNNLLTQQFGFNDQALANELAKAGWTRDYGIGQANQQQSMATNQTYSDAASRGSVVTQGTRDTLSNIDIAHDQAVQNFNKQFGFTTQSAQLAHDQQAAGLKAQWDDNYWQGLIDTAKTAEQKAAVQDQLKGLDILEQQYGLDRQRIANSIGSALANLNLNRVLSVNQVLQGMNSTSEKVASLMYGIAQQAMAGANAGASLPVPQSNASTSDFAATPTGY